MTKPGPKLDPERVARILVDADLLGTDAAAARHKIHVRTVIRYRVLAERDRNLSDLVTRLKRSIGADWFEGLGAAIKAQIDFLTHAAAEANPRSASSVNAVTNALKALAEVGLTSQVVNARIADQNREVREEDDLADGAAEAPPTVQ
jgi:hypothetical protein